MNAQVTKSHVYIGVTRDMTSRLRVNQGLLLKDV